MGKNVRLLVLEDDDVLRSVLTEVLSANGFDVTAASGGEEALSMARTQPFDLIIADIRMQGINGLDTIEQARAVQPDLGSIVVSGFASEDETLRAVGLNVAGYLKKPFKIPELLELIHKYLSQRHKQQNRHGEVTSLRRALFWSLKQQGQWAELAFPGKVTNSAYLAGALTSFKGLSKAEQEQAYIGTGLRAAYNQRAFPVPRKVFSIIEQFTHLAQSWNGDSISEFATMVGSTFTKSWPSVDELPSSTSGEVKMLYGEFLSRKEQFEQVELDVESDEVPSSQNLFSLALTFEQIGDFESADKAFERIGREEQASHRTVLAFLGKARIAGKSGRTPLLEQAVKDGLEHASKMGALTLAQYQLDAARILRRYSHPAAEKLLKRAEHSLDSMELHLPWVLAVLALKNLGAELEADKVQRALQLLEKDEVQPDLTESLTDILPELLLLACSDNHNAQRLCERLVRSLPYLVPSALASDILSEQGKEYAVEILLKFKLGVSKSLLESLGDSELANRVRATQVSQEADTPITVRCMGTLDVLVGEHRLTERDWRTRKVKFVLARLVAAFPKPVAVERLMEEFWETTAEKARNNLNTCVSLLRKSLKEIGSLKLEPVQRIGETLGLNPKLRIWNDFQELLEAHRQSQVLLDAGETEQAATLMVRVVRLYRGAYLDDCYLDWAAVRRAECERILETTLITLTEHRFSQHRFRESHEYSIRLLKVQPDEVRAHEVAMLSLLGLDRHQQAIEHYENYCHQLKTQLGAEPPVELFKIYQMARYGFEQSTGLSDI